MSSPYTSVAISGYNADPPDDDGSQVATNQLDWDFHLDKIGEPLKTAVESINTNTLAAFTGIYGQTDAEANALLTPADTTYLPGNALRYGLVPNSSADRSANTVALQAALDPDTSVYKGRFIFPNTTGTDTYYFDDIVPIRDGIHMDLQGCTLDFAKTYVAADDSSGFLYFIRNCSVANGLINVDYDGSAGTNAGNAIKIGNRSDTGAHFPGDDEDYTHPQGQCLLLNLRITSNNPGSAVIQLLGGLDGIMVEAVDIDGTTVCDYGIHYEYGFWHVEEGAETVSDRLSSHAQNMSFRNIRVENLDSAEVSSAGIVLVGAWNSSIENLWVKTAGNAVVCRPGEALYYNVGGIDGDLVKRNIILRNISGESLVQVGVDLKAASTASTGYLSGEGLTESEQVDLMAYSLDGFAIDGPALGIKLSGPCRVRNGLLINCTDGVVMTDECVDFSLDRIDVLDSTTLGMRLAFGSPIFATERKKVGSITNCFIAGSGSHAISIDHTESVYIGFNRIGYTAAHDGVAEATQDSAVAAFGDSDGLVCEGNTVAVFGGATAYTVTSGPTNGCDIVNPRGVVTSSGFWARNRVPQASSANFTDISHPINTDGPYLGKIGYDTSNGLLLLKTGAGPVDTWETTDGVLQHTPA